MKEILIVEDIAETRRWLGDIASTAFPGCTISEARNMRAGISAVASKDFDLAMIDLGLPDGSGLDVLRNLRLVQPKAACIITTVMGEDSHIVAALSAGADGYLLKEQPEDLLIQQLRQLAQGIPALTPSIARRIMEHFRYTGPAADPEDELSSREKEVLALIGRGLRNVEVAEDLDIAEGTVASHIKTIYRKLGISSRAEAAWHAARMGLVAPRQTGR
ncbi:Protease production enhancer protein [Thalassovita gelatinovora]|uniref:Protease production enhancer protein n=1 Tax=Thalassovita gelatinovora TaxID=53501 RepID=A0A0P1FU31_THAGE|nr:response regulator transcription factor [Thalassovita gelatinovora]QIZ79472.1 response regulator transcription factor [Thalassovita gelatinovora]CUH62846.1 Protease production enhancer protein [Thalassovita gelatinovora]SEQ11469.1 two component transcriptional regulator, LuxR family [Thalassovita gelatinovora]